jgi:hypothetical protein
MIKGTIFSILLGPFTGVLLTDGYYLLFSGPPYLRSLAASHPMLTASYFTAEIFTVYATGGYGWGFRDMWSWVLIGVAVNFIVIAQPWRWVQPSLKPR